MSQPLTPPPPPAPPAPPAPGAKKMSPLAKVGIGCLIVAVLCAIAIGVLFSAGVHFLKKKAENPTLAAAELMVRANPDLEVVDSDSKAGTLTIRNTKTGEVVTMNAKDIEDGKITFTTKEGTTVFDASKNGENGGSVKVTNEKGEQATFSAGEGAPKDLPSWVPSYAGGTVAGSYDATTAEGRSAAFTVTTSDSVDKVVEFYESQLKAAGLTVQKNSFEGGGQKTVMLVGTGSDDKRTMTVSVSPAEGKTQAVVNFNEKK
jgi:hypothetical protein